MKGREGEREEEERRGRTEREAGREKGGKVIRKNGSG